MNWLKQTSDKPLFPDMLWSKPENKKQAGKLLIVGGNSHAFAAVSSAYSFASKAGVGSCSIVVPDALQKTLGKIFPEAEFAPSTPSGSFARLALGQILEMAESADGVLLAGNFGHNSETAILLESFISKYAGLVALAGDSLDYFLTKPDLILNRADTLVIGDLGQLQKLSTGTVLIKHSMDLAQLVGAIAELSAETKCSFATVHPDQIIVADKGQVSTTAANNVDLLKLAAYASVWQMQQPTQAFDALACSAYCYIS